MSAMDRFRALWPGGQPTLAEAPESVLGEWQKYSSDSAPPTQSDRLMGQMEAGGDYPQYAHRDSLCKLCEAPPATDQLHAISRLSPKELHTASAAHVPWCRRNPQQRILQLAQCRALGHQHSRRYHQRRGHLRHIIVSRLGLQYRTAAAIHIRELHSCM
jgi:hypothetical protein